MSHSLLIARAKPANKTKHLALGVPCRYQSPRLGQPRNAICWCSHSAGQRLVAMVREMRTRPPSACLDRERLGIFLP